MNRPLGQRSGMSPERVPVHGVYRPAGMEPTPRDEMDAMLDALLSFAQQMIAKHGEFFPFAAALDSSGELQMVAGDVGEEHPDSSELIDLLYDGLSQQASSGEIRAAGVCDPTWTPEREADANCALST